MRVTGSGTDGSALLANVFTKKGPYNAATNTPDLDTTPIAGIKSGDSYNVSVAGDFFTEAVEVGDLLVACTDDPTMLSDWLILQGNIDVSALFRQNTLFGDDTYGDNATGVSDDPTKPFKTIGATITASAAEDLLDIAPGPYAEALVITKNLFVRALGVTGLTSIDISAGVLTGRVGKIEYSANGCIIYGDSDDDDNGDCLKFAHAVGSTTSEAFKIKMTGANYDLGADQLDLFTNPNARNNSFEGIGASPAIITTSNATAFLDYTANSFKNIDIQNGAAFNRFGITPENNEDPSGSIKNVNASSVILLTSGTGKSTGDHEHITCFRWMVSGSGKNESKMIDISASDRIEIIAGNTKRVDISACPSGLVLAGTFDKRVDCKDEKSQPTTGNRTVTFTAGFYCAGVLLSDGPTQAGVYDAGYMVMEHETSTLSQRGVFPFDILKNSFRLDKSRLFFLGGTGADPTIAESSFSLKNSDLRYTSIALNGDSGGIEFKGSCDFCDIEGVTGALGLAVSTGANVRHSSFHGFDATINPAIRGQNLLINYGAATFPTYFFTPNTLVYPLLKQPQESDGAGGRVAIADLTIFKQTIYLLADQAAPGAGENLSNLEGLLAEMQVFQDGANIYGFGAGTWVIRTTATDAAVIDALLSAPGSDLVSLTASFNSITGKAATGIDLEGTNLGGGFVGQEISVKVNQPEVRTVTADTQVLFNENTIHADSTAGDVDVTCLPEANQLPFFVRKTVAGNNVIIKNDAGGTIFTLTSADQTVEVYSDGTTIFTR